MRRVLTATAVAAALLGATATSALAKLTDFVSPSRNISCIGETKDSYVRCDIKRYTFKPPPKPRNCDLDWGEAYSISARGRGRGVCHGDTTQPSPGARVRVLGYGKSIRVGRITCTSRATGLTCRNRAGHGFTLSRQRLRLF